MAHVFDTELAKPQRTIVRENVVARLRAWSRLAYVQEVVEIGGIMISGSPEEVGVIAEEAGSKSPLLLVALGATRWSLAGEGSHADHYAADLEIFVYAWSKNLRSRLARVKGDAVSAASDLADPGCEAMLEHAAETLVGYKPAPSWTPSIFKIVPVVDSEIEVGSDFALWRSAYSVRLERELVRHRGVTQPITSIHAKHHVDGAEPQNPLVETRTQTS